MKILNKALKKITPIMVCCLTLVLCVSANSTSCYVINEPKEPKSIERFKLFK